VLAELALPLRGKAVMADPNDAERTTGNAGGGINPLSKR